MKNQPNWPPLIQKRDRYQQGDPTDHLWSKNVTVTNREIQLTTFDPKTLPLPTGRSNWPPLIQKRYRYQQGDPTDHLWSKNVTVTNTGPNRPFRCLDSDCQSESDLLDSIRNYCDVWECLLPCKYKCSRPNWVIGKPYQFHIAVAHLVFTTCPRLDIQFGKVERASNNQHRGIFVPLHKISHRWYQFIYDLAQS